MNLFTWLVIGHLIGDWLFQNDWMARGKKRALVTAEGMLHFTIYTLAVMFTFLIGGGGSAGLPLFLFVTAIIFCSHWYIDATDVVGNWVHLMHQTDIPMVRIMVDQTFHLLVLAGIAVLLQL